jgi:regulator of sirC expression with transglutaminase-like and TPR domain
MQQVPHFCRPRAYDLFREQLDILETTNGLVVAATAVAMHELEGVQPDLVLGRLDQLASRIRGRVHSSHPEALLAHVHDVLFVEERFAGNTDEYYLAENSYLPAVLQTKRGLPIILALIYKSVAEGVGLEVAGINSPGHFLAKVRLGTDWMIVDPFFHGQSLSQEEAFARLEQVSGREMPHDIKLLPTATHAQWLARIIANLQSLFAAQGRREDLAAMTELQELLAETLF